MIKPICQMGCTLSNFKINVNGTYSLLLISDIDSNWHDFIHFKLVVGNETTSASFNLPRFRAQTNTVSILRTKLCCCNPIMQFGTSVLDEFDQDLKLQRWSDQRDSQTEKESKTRRQTIPHCS